MSSELPSSPDAESVRAPRNLDIYSAAAFRDALLAQAARPTVVVDLAPVESCDIAGLQVLWAVKRSAEASGRSFVVRNTPPVLLQACSGLGLDATQLLPPSP